MQCQQGATIILSSYIEIQIFLLFMSFGCYILKKKMLLSLFENRLGRVFIQTVTFLNVVFFNPLAFLKSSRPMFCFRHPSRIDKWSIDIQEDWTLCVFLLLRNDCLGREGSRMYKKGVRVSCFFLSFLFLFFGTKCKEQEHQSARGEGVCV